MVEDTRDLSAILARQKLRPSKLSHVFLRTKKLAPMKDWYLKVLNADVVFEDTNVCFMTYDQEHHRLGLAQMPHIEGKSEVASGLEHFSFTFATLGELLANYRRLKALDIEPYWPILHGPTVSFYYKDPDGNRVELQYDVFDAKGADAFIAEHYAENFMGIIFDPEEMIRLFESGTSLEEITRRPKLPEGTTAWDMHRA